MIALGLFVTLEQKAIGASSKKFWRMADNTKAWKMLQEESKVL